MEDYTREELLLMVDNCSKSEDFIKLRELSKTNPGVRIMLQEIRSQESGNGSVLDIVTRGLRVGLEVKSGDDNGMFEIIDQYLSMPSVMSKKLTFENKEDIIDLVGGFISTSTLPKEKLDILTEKMDKMFSV